MGQKIWGACCAVVIAAALTAPARAEEAKIVSPGDAVRRIEAALSQPLKTPLQFVETPLSQVMTIISEDYEIPIQFDKAALDAVASSPDVEVSIDIANVSLRSALELMLSNAGAEELTYIIDREVLLMTTQEQAEKKLEVIVYRVDDLLDDDEATFDRLLDVIVSTVDHESWMENGTGEGEALSYPPGMIIISQTRRVHDRVERLLDQMRTAKRGILADSAESQAAAATQPVTRSIKLNDKVIADSEEARSVIRDAVKKSVDWQREVEGVDRDQLFLYVLPNRVLVRHVPEVVSEVARAVRRVSPAQKVAIGSSSIHRSMGVRRAADLADPTQPGEDNQPRPQGRGEGVF